MAEWLDAYDKTSGKKVPYKVPAKWFGIFSNLRKTLIQKAREADQKAVTATSKKEG